MSSKLTVFSPAANASHIDLTHAGEVCRVHIKATAGARKFTLRVRAASHDVVLTMPATGSLRAAREFAARNAGWICARLRQLPQRLRLEDGAVIPVRGAEHLIVHRTSMRGVIWVEANPDPAGAPMLLCVAGKPAHIERRVVDYLKKEALRDISEAVRCHAAKIGKSARKITLRDTTSRWGSCSSAGSLSFSWRLIFAPGYILDYLAAHEVAHLVHMDHSDRFWQLANQLSPDLQRAEAWLKKNGAALHRFGPHR